jgi:hypothetical protein
MSFLFNMTIFECDIATYTDVLAGLSDVYNTKSTQE